MPESVTGLPKVGLLVKKPWVDLILSGEKTWELRTRKTNHRGRFAVIRSGSGTVAGEAEVEDVVGPFTREELRELDRHHRADAFLDDPKIAGRSFYGWMLRNALRYDTPVPYSHPAGAVIWVRLS